MRDLFGVECEEPLKSGSLIVKGGDSAPVRSELLTRRLRRPVPFSPVPGSLAARLGITATALSDRTRAERRDDRQRFLEQLYRPASPESSLDLMTLRAHVDFFGVAQKHIAAGRIDGAYRSIAPDSESGVRGQVERLLRAIKQSVYSLPRNTAAESFPDERLRADLQREKLKTRSRVLVQTQTDLPPLGKLGDIRYLRAKIRNRVSELYTVRSPCRKCGRRRHSRTGVDFYTRPGRDGKDRIAFEGVVRCGSVWSCVSCGARISAIRATLLKQIIGAHRGAGGGVYMGTFTFPHTSDLACRTARRLKSEAWELFQQGSPWPRLKKRMGFLGSVAATEVTHGANGWHVHLHILFATRAPLPDCERAEIEDALFAQWASALERQTVARVPLRNAGGEWRDALRDRAVTLTPCDDETYLQKLGLADELTRAVYKAARGGSRTAYEIMADYTRDRDARDGALLREYHLGMSGARQLTFSRGKILPCAHCSAHAELPERERRQLCPTRGFHGLTDLRRLYPPGGADPLQLALLDGEDANAEALQQDDKAGTHIAYVPPGQWDALVQVMNAARSDAGAELVLAIEEHGAAGVPAVLESAYRLGMELATRRRRLTKYLWWLDPRRRELNAR